MKSFVLAEKSRSLTSKLPTEQKTYVSVRALEYFLTLLYITGAGSFHQLFVDVTGNLSLEELFQKLREMFCTQNNATNVGSKTMQHTSKNNRAPAPERR